MEDYKYLIELELIDKNNLFLRYITNRVASKEYRGVQCSQHNRLTFEYFSKLIDCIYQIAGNSIFGIHVGDDDNKKQPNALLYYDIVKLINDIVGKGTVNSVKKNTFPDIARMGFLDRYNKDGEKLIEGSHRGCVYSVGLSKLGERFAQADTFGRIKLYTDGIDRLLKNIASEMVELLCLNDNGIEYIDIIEFMYILSDDRDGITIKDKQVLLLEWRRLSNNDKNKVHQCLKNYANPSNRKEMKNKNYLRDYYNWKNESQQIFGLLANSTYFKVEKNRLILNTGNYGLFDMNILRGSRAKTEYFKNHRINKERGYDLHHIVPFSTAQNKSDSILIDDYRNLIYLKDRKHDEFTTAGSRNIIMNYSNDCGVATFVDFDEKIIIVDLQKDALVKRELLPKIKEYNKMLIKRFFP